MQIDRIDVDCSGFEKTGNQPVLVLKSSQYPCGAGGWHIASSYVGDEVKDWSLVTENSELIRIPLFSYTTKEQDIFAAGLSVGVAFGSCAKDRLPGHPGSWYQAVRRIILAVGEIQPLDGELSRFWVGFAALIQ